MKRWIVRILIAGAALFVLMQVVPYGRNHGNPKAVAEPKWDSPRTRALAQQACFDCHSNLTTWPWYSNVAPVSWLVYADVKGGREQLNFSRWDRPQDVSPEDIVEAVRGGGMPPFQYPIMHPKAKLSAAEKAQLADGLAKTIQASPPGSR